MKLINEWLVPRIRGTRGPAVIQLLQGDLAELPEEHAVDALVVSALPDAYVPTTGTLFESLYRRGLDMRQVAERKQDDERAYLGCWISEPMLPDIIRMFRFRRIICFEPRYPAFKATVGADKWGVEETVAFVFRCLNNFTIPDRNGSTRFDISTVAMPLLATGVQRVDPND